MDTSLSVVNPNILDAVSVSAVDWRLIGRHLLSAMSGSEGPLASRPWEIESPSSFPPKVGSEGPRDEGDEGRERRKLKNEDSSYDSDFDPCESTSPLGGDGFPGGSNAPHEDVSRTASETLAAEFEDYVTLPPAIPRSPQAFTILPSVVGPSSSSSTTSSPPVLTITEATPQPLLTAPSFSPPPSASALKGAEEDFPSRLLADVVESAEYPQQVEFGVKLGYSESLVQLALTKLGLNPDKNELLDELIRLGAGAPRSDCEEQTEGDEGERPPLRQIIIDGSNVAMSHGNKLKFSCKGIRLCVDWFRARGHKEILVFVPMWRKEQSRLDAIITDQDVLLELEKEGVLSFTPSRSCGGKRIVAYDDRYIIREAIKSDGVVVSNDNYRDLINESAAFRKVIETSLLMYCWVNGRFEPPDDPLGRNGPSLDVFLRKPVPGNGAVVVKDSRPCPYGRKCTYGNKCKYMHPERGAAPVKSVTERLQEQKQKHYLDKAKSRDSSPGENLRAKSLSLPVSTSESGGGKKPLTRTQSTFHSVSLSQAAATKEGTILEYPNIVSSVSSESICTTMLTPTTSQGPTVESSSGAAMSAQGDNPLFTMCPSQLGFRTWQNQESVAPNQPSKIPLSFSPHITENEVSGVSAENLHPKLQRQLSINPGGDDRLSKISKQFIGSASGDYTNMMSSFSLQQQKHQPLLHQQLLQPPPPSPQQQQSQQQQSVAQPHHRLLEAEALTNRSCIGSRCISPGPAYSHGYGSRDLLQTYLHTPLTRHSSTQETKSMTYSQHMFPPCFHNPVGRNLSAPDQIRGGAKQQLQNLIPHITRFNSTSDSRLNIHGSSSESFVSDCFDDGSMGCLSYSSMPLSSISSSSPGPIRSRPMSPQQPLTGMIPQQSLPSSPRSQVPSHLTQSSSLGLTHGLSGTNTHEDERLKIFYHLSQLFPQAQVRLALARNPDETDPTKICMSILSMSGCRPVSPQQLGTGVSPLPGLSGGNLGLRGTSFGTPFPSSAAAPCHDTTREVARIEAYSKLSKLFPDDQVRNVLQRYPDETDPYKLCTLLMASNSQS